MMAAFQLEVTPDGGVAFHGVGTDIDRMEALVRWHAEKARAETDILIAEDPNSQWECIRIEVIPAGGDDAQAGARLVCALDHEFRESGCFHCIRRWVKGPTWGWLVRHLPGSEWVHPEATGGTDAGGGVEPALE
jgi:hypothetical protein